MQIHISQLDEKYLVQMAKLYMVVYSEPDRKWDFETALKYLHRDWDNYKQYCLQAASEEGICLGAVFCRVEPYYTGDVLIVDSLQVDPEHRNKGVAKALLVKVLKLAEENQLIGAHLLADIRKDFPKRWYEKLGFETTGWGEFEYIWRK